MSSQPRSLSTTWTNNDSAGAVGLYKTSTIGLVARDADFTYGTAFPLIWLAAEVSATIIASSIPFFRPLVRLATGTEQKNSSSSYNLSKVSRPGTNRLVRTHDHLEGEGDDGSDKFILKGKSNILRSTTFTVEHSYQPEDAISESRDPRRGHQDLF